MKEEILKILDTYSPNVIKELPLDKNKQYLIGERESTISQLTALMCYREVRAYWLAYDHFYTWELFAEEVKRDLCRDYTKEIIEKAIDELKNS